MCKITNIVGNRCKIKYDLDVQLYWHCENYDFLKFKSVDNDDLDYLLGAL